MGLLELGVPEEEVERDVRRWRQEIAPLTATAQPAAPDPFNEPPSSSQPEPSGETGLPEPEPPKRYPMRTCDPDRWRGQVEEEGFDIHLLAVREDYDAAVFADKKTALDRLRGLLGQREYKVVAVERCAVRLPLFVLAAPAISGSSVTYTESITADRSYGWSITAFGSGTGNDRTITATASSSFTAAAGDRQLIFLPAVIEVADVEVRRRGQVIGRGPRTQLISPAAGDIAHQASRPLHPDELFGEPDPFAPPEQPFDLVDARPTDIPRIEESWKASSEMRISLGVTAFKLDLKCAAKIRRVREVKISFALPGGTTYRAIRLRNPEGLAWQIG